MNVRKQAIKDKLQGSVATHLRCGGVVNKHTKKRFTAESVSEFFYISEYLAKLQARTSSFRALSSSFSSVVARRTMLITQPIFK